MVSPERLRELEWAATYLKNTRRRKGCRCGGSCDECKKHNAQAKKITPEAVLELIAHIEQREVTPGTSHSYSRH